MKPSQALQVVASLLEQTRITPPEHRQLQAAMAVLTEAIFPKPRLEKPTIKDKEPNEKPKA